MINAKFFLILLTVLCLAAPTFGQGLQEPKVGVDLDFSGYYRMRYNNFFQRGWIAGSDSDWDEYFDQRFMLMPTFSIGDRISIVAQFDILRNTLFGQNFVAQEPVLYVERERQGIDTDFPVKDLEWSSIDTAAGNVFSETASSTDRNLDEVPSIEVTRLYGDVLLPFGRLLFGRQPNNFGMGLLANDGLGVDDDFGDTIDQIKFSTKIGPVVSSLAYGRLAEGDITSSFTDIHHAALTVGYFGLPVSAATYLSFRGQDATDTTMYFFGLWAKALFHGFTIEGEAFGVQGSSVQVPKKIVNDLIDGGYPIGEGGGRLQISAYLAALKAQYDAPAWGTGLETGFSSPADGGQGAEFDYSSATAVLSGIEKLAADPDNGDDQLEFLDAVISNQRAFAKKLNSYPFDPDYSVDLLIWEELMGGAVANGLYVKAWGRANPFEWMDLRLDVIKSFINTPGNCKNGKEADKDLGWEVDLEVGFTMAKYFRMNIQFAHAWIGQYFNDTYRGTSNPFTIQSNFMIEF